MYVDNDFQQPLLPPQRGDASDDYFPENYYECGCAWQRSQSYGAGGLALLNAFLSLFLI